MAKKYTVMIFDPEIHGKNRTIFLSTRPFWVAGFVLLFFVLTTGIASFLAYSFYQDSRLQQAAVGGDINSNAVFKAQFANYLQQLDELNSKLAELDELEQLVYELQPTAEFKRTMLAEQYHQSMSDDIRYDPIVLESDQEDEVFEN